MPIPSLRVFVSSPGDVGHERVLTAHVMNRLHGEFAGVLDLQAVLWESEPLRATAHFQAEIPRPSQADIVVCILWSRLGTRLPEEYRRPDGSRYDSGTEWEFEDAAQSFRDRGKPDLLVYRKTAQPNVEPGNEEEYAEQLRQKKALDGFLNRWFVGPDGTFKAAFHAFETLDQFEDMVHEHLRKLIVAKLPAHWTEEASPRVWTSGSPFRGLEPFEAEHAPIFFGRTLAVGTVKDALTRQATLGRAFVLILGGSGSGKSSLARAGVVPAVTTPGVVEGVDLWRWCILEPGGVSSGVAPGEVTSLCEQLSQALLHPTALPELKRDYHVGSLANLIRESPSASALSVRTALARAADASRSELRLAGRLEARLLVVVDQMEEMFTREGTSPAERERFVAALSALARDGATWVIATIRSEFYARCAELPELVALKQGDGQYDLLPPSLAEIGKMIREPARSAGLKFEVDPATGRSLADILHEQAARDPLALPLLEFTLDQLYQRRTDERVLTFKAYRTLGGLEGAITGRAEKVVEILSPKARAALPSLFRMLVTVDPKGEGEASARRASLAALENDPSLHELVNALVEARLLVMDRGGDGRVVFSVAHEALIRHWARLQQWLADDREFLRVRARVSDAAMVWEVEERNPDLLLSDGKPLDEAARLLADHARDLEPRPREFVRQSIGRSRRRRRRRWVSWSAVSMFIAALIAGGVGYWIAYRKPHVEYYANFAKRWGAWQGIGPLSPSDVAHRQHSFRFTRRGLLGSVYTVDIIGAMTGIPSTVGFGPPFGVRLHPREHAEVFQRNFFGH